MVAVVIPCYRVVAHIDAVLTQIPKCVDHILIVDDACPENSGSHVEATCTDSRVSVIRHTINQGVGGAVMTGFKEALDLDVDVIVKIDGDGQMDPVLIPNFVEPIRLGLTDYAKGNRFFYLDTSESMPAPRRIGNLGLTFISRFSTGYYSMTDPTNGYFAIDARLAAQLPFHKIAKRYFFETDLLFRLNTLNAQVLDIPHHAHYGDEESGLNAGKELFRFAKLHMRTGLKRLLYQYLLRDFSIGSVFLALGILMLSSGLIGGLIAFTTSQVSGIARSGGTITLFELSIVLGVFFAVGFLNHDINREPRHAISNLLSVRPVSPLKQFSPQ